MAVYNGKEHLYEAINGIANQTYNNWECIIVNDGSQDSTKEILNSLHDKRFKVIHLKKNHGAANALNTGIAQAKGEWIAIHDADDISLSNRIEQQINHVKKNPDLVAVCSHIRCFSNDVSVSQKVLFQYAYNRNSLNTNKEIQSYLFYGCPICHGSVLFSKNAFYKAGGYNNNYKIAYDYDLWSRLSFVGPIENIPEVLYEYRIYHDSLSNKNIIQTGIESIKISNEYINRYFFKNHNRFPKYILIGTKASCDYFIHQVLSNDSNKPVFIIDSYFSRCDKVIHKLLKENIADIALILENTSTKNIDKFIKNNQLLNLNENVFKIWNPLN
nr:glycosyltransferase [Sutcliffiella horikoshii]